MSATAATVLSSDDSRQRRRTPCMIVAFGIQLRQNSGRDVLYELAAELALSVSLSRIKQYAVHMRRGLLAHRDGDIRIATRAPRLVDANS